MEPLISKPAEGICTEIVPHLYRRKLTAVEKAVVDEVAGTLAPGLAHLYRCMHPSCEGGTNMKAFPETQRVMLRLARR